MERSISHLRANYSHAFCLAKCCSRTRMVNTSSVGICCSLSDLRPTQPRVTMSWRRCVVRWNSFWNILTLIRLPPLAKSVHVDVPSMRVADLRCERPRPRIATASPGLLRSGQVGQPEKPAGLAPRPKLLRAVHLPPPNRDGRKLNRSARLMNLSGKWLLSAGGEPCVNMLPTHCPNWLGFWAKFEVCSDAASRSCSINKSRNNRFSAEKHGGRDRDRTCDPYHVKVVLFR